MEMYLTPKRTGLRARSCAPANLIRDATCLRVRRVIEIDTMLAVNVVDHWRNDLVIAGHTPSPPGIPTFRATKTHRWKAIFFLTFSVWRKTRGRMYVHSTLMPRRFSIFLISNLTALNYDTLEKCISKELEGFGRLRWFSEARWVTKDALSPRSLSLRAEIVKSAPKARYATRKR